MVNEQAYQVQPNLAVNFKTSKNIIKVSFKHQIPQDWEMKAEGKQQAILIKDGVLEELPRRAIPYKT